jgi:F-type H+-transporting ATPase subunit a
MGTVALAELSAEELQKEILHTWEVAKHSWVIPIHVGGIDLSINKIIWFLWLGAAITFLVLFIGSRLLKDRPGAYQVIVEEVYGFGRQFLGGQIGEAGYRWFPYTLSIFVFLLTLNLIGLVPGSYPVTSNISFTITLALLTFLITLYQGIKHNGVGRYFKSWVPPGLPLKIVMVPFIFFVEVISQLTRPLTLAVRLYANILAGHLIIFVFLSFILYFGTLTAVVSVPVTVVFYAFEIFVAVLQAYIFAILTQVYIELAIYADESH